MNFLDTIFKNRFGGGLNGVANQLFYLGLIIAVVLAVVTIIRGGIQYMTTDSITGKEDGKKLIQAALGGLVLAFSGVLILNTINPNITQFNLTFAPVMLEQGRGYGIINPTESNESGSVTTTNPDGTRVTKKTDGTIISVSPDGIMTITRPDGKIETIRPGQASQKILQEAQDAVGKLQTCNIAGTEGGNKGCAAAVNQIVENALGVPVGGGLSTAAMYEALKKSDTFVLVGSNYNEALPGDIIISPTQQGSTGHVGIVSEPGATKIISNSSKLGEVAENYSSASWNNRYVDNKSLGVYIYRPR